jgi:hypothetical protein
MKIQFSNRGEVDLGTEASGYTSYFHFYTEGTASNDTKVEGLPTCYDDSWVLDVTQDPEDTFWEGYSAAGPYPQSGMAATLDLATAINPTAGKAWAAAFWPSLSDWTIDGWPMWWRSMDAMDPHDIDASNWGPAPRAEPSIPYYIGEWDVEMLPVGRTSHQAFRFVTVYMVTDLWDGDDVHAGGSNVIDSEIMYQVDEVFNPWDLVQSVHKKNTRHVWIDEVTSMPLLVLPEHPFLRSCWDSYCTFSERVLLDGELLVPRRSTTQGPYDYEVIVDTMGYGWIVFDSPVTGHLKVLYSTDTEYTNMNNYLESWSTNGTWMGPQRYVVPDQTGSFMDPLGATHSWRIYGMDFLLTQIGPFEGDFNRTFTGELHWSGEDFKVWKESVTVFSRIYDFMGRTYDGVNPPFNLTLNQLEMDWTIVPPTDEKLDYHVDWMHLDLNWAITAAWNMTTQSVMVTVDFDINGRELRQDQLYTANIPGRYEWVVVGRNSAAVDSAGAALVAAAFKNKQVEIGLAGTDMMYAELANQIPWVMSKIGSGDTVADYHYDYAGGDHRTALKDDWCTTWPIASSNMIGVGGPLANVLAWYGNDFTNAFYGLDAFTDWTWENKVAALSCWNKNSYMSSEATGYAAVSTYKDINGTVLFLVWGNWGRDTYYATKWFHEEGIFQLQDAPCGLTDVILKIDYADPEHPTFKIVECLGTISETEWYHGYTKGGIHDP